MFSVACRAGTCRHIGSLQVTSCGDTNEKCHLYSQTFEYSISRWWHCLGQLQHVTLLDEVPLEAGWENLKDLCDS